jgi:hypothetical protein
MKKIKRKIKVKKLTRLNSILNHKKQKKMNYSKKRAFNNKKNCDKGLNLIKSLNLMKAPSNVNLHGENL